MIFHLDCFFNTRNRIGLIKFNIVELQITNKFSGFMQVFIMEYYLALFHLQKCLALFEIQHFAPVFFIPIFAHYNKKNNG